MLSGWWKVSAPNFLASGENDTGLERSCLTWHGLASEVSPGTTDGTGVKWLSGGSHGENYNVS